MRFWQQFKNWISPPASPDLIELAARCWEAKERSWDRERVRFTDRIHELEERVNARSTRIDDLEAQVKAWEHGSR